MTRVATGVAPSDQLLESLKVEHRALERRLAELERHLSLSPTEQTERANLKKMKLVVKEKLFVLERQSPR